MAARKKVTEIEGIFFKCKEVNKMKDWYQRHLGLKTNEYGALFEFRSTDDPQQKGYLQWSPFPENNKSFKPSNREFMINYNVENLETLIKELKAEGVKIVAEMEVYEYGKFVRILDAEGNKVELWEPVDQVFTDLYENKTTH